MQICIRGESNYEDDEILYEALPATEPRIPFWRIFKHLDRLGEKFWLRWFVPAHVRKEQSIVYLGHGNEAPFGPVVSLMDLKKMKIIR